MSYQLKVALEGGIEESKRQIEARHKEITRIAFRPSKRQRGLVSKKAETISGRDHLLYKGENLKRGYR